MKTLHPQGDLLPHPTAHFGRWAKTSKVHTESGETKNNFAEEEPRNKTSVRGPRSVVTVR